ncbi:hypothetical protein [Streptomyces sp. SYSU K21746]
MNAMARASLPWLPPATVWHVKAGEHWDAIRVPCTLGKQVVDDLGGACGPVICDPWTRILYFLTPPGSTAGWELRETVPCGTATYVVVPPLNADEHVLHWVVPPTADRAAMDIGSLRAALERVIDQHFGPRTEHFG